MMHLATSSPQPQEKPSNFELACRIVKDVLRRERHANFLLTDGKWVPAHIDDIMRRANERRKSIGRTQFTGKREWIV